MLPHLPVQLGEGVVDETLPPGEAAQLGDDGQLLLHALVCTVDTLQLPSHPILVEFLHFHINTTPIYTILKLKSECLYKDLHWHVVFKILAENKLPVSEDFADNLQLSIIDVKIEEPQ